MGSDGDIATVLSLDDFEYMTGLRDAARETRQFQQESESAFGALGEGIERSSHRMIHSLGHIAFLVSENNEGGIGHQLLRMTMIAPMIGEAFGPVGMAVGGAAAIIGATLIPQMQKAQEEAKEMAREIAEAGKEFERMVGVEKSGVGFGRRLERINAGTSPETIQSEKESAEDTAAELRDEITRRRAQFRNQISTLATKGGLVGDLAGRFGPDNAPRGAFELRETGNQGQDLKAEAEAAREMYQRLHEAEETLERMEHRAEALGEKLEDSVEFHTALEEQQKLLDEEKKREEIAGRIAKEIATPFEVAQEKLRELTGAAARGIITPEMFGKATDKTLKDLEKSTAVHNPEQTNVAVRAGTGEAYRAIRESIKSTEKQEDNPQVKALREQIALMKQQLGATQEVARKTSTIVKF